MWLKGLQWGSTLALRTRDPPITQVEIPTVKNCATSHTKNLARMPPAARWLPYTPARMPPAARWLPYSPARMPPAARWLSYSPARMPPAARSLPYSPARMPPAVRWLPQPECLLLRGGYPTVQPECPLLRGSSLGRPQGEACPKVHLDLPDSISLQHVPYW